jgi:type I restriction enzyme S subunit
MGIEYPFVALGDVAAVRSGFAFKSSDWADGGIPVVKIGNVKDGRLAMDGCSFVRPEVATAAAEFALKPGDILIAMTGYIGEVALVRPHDLPAMLNQRVGRFAIREKERLEPRFLFYLLKLPEIRSEVEGLGYGSAQPNVSPSLIHKVRIPLPTLAEQRAIAQVLSTFDEKIEFNRGANETLEATARALFKSWFVDFDPVRATASDQEPRGLAPDVEALFPDAFDQSQMPLGWHLGQLSDVASVVMGASPPGETYNESGVGVPLVNGPVEYGNFFLEKKKWTTRPTQLSRKGDLILCVRGSTTGRHAFADDEYCLGRGVCAIRALRSAQALVNRLVLNGLPELLSKTTGSVFPNLSSEDIKSFSVVVPPSPIVELYCELVAPLDQRIWNNVSESRTLSTLRDSLLPKLISGELRVKHAQPLVHEALGRAKHE